KERLLLPPGQERVRSRVVPYSKRRPFTTAFLDEPGPEAAPFGELPRPDSPSAEAVLLARTFRHACGLDQIVYALEGGTLPPTAEAFDGIDHFVVASGRLARDPAGLRALRRWLERGGRVWVMLDRVGPDVVAPLLGEALDFEVVDRVGLTTFEVLMQPAGRAPPDPPQHHERPVEFVRVLLPPGERVRHTVEGWPAWFTRRVGRGTVVFTTLGPRGWFRPRTRGD